MRLFCHAAAILSGNKLRRRVLILLACLAAAVPAAAENPLRVVGVLGNTSGMSDRPLPYAFYSGIAVDGRGRLYLGGAAQGIVVCDQEGRCLAVLPLGDLPGYAARSLLVRAGESVFGVALAAGGTQSALFRIDTSAADPARLKTTRIAAGPGRWALSATLDPKGRIVVGQSQPSALRYSVLTLEPEAGRLVPLFEVDEPKGSQPPWRHLIQVDPDGAISIQHSGGVDWSGRYAADGRRLGDAIQGQLLGSFRYHFGYEGGLRRMDLSDAEGLARRVRVRGPGDPHGRANGPGRRSLLPGRARRGCRGRMERHELRLHAPYWRRLPGGHHRRRPIAARRGLYRLWQRRRATRHRAAQGPAHRSDAPRRKPAARRSCRGLRARARWHDRRLPQFQGRGHALRRLAAAAVRRGPARGPLDRPSRLAGQRPAAGRSAIGHDLAPAAGRKRCPHLGLAHGTAAA